jgi:hypothetical protein
MNGRSGNIACARKPTAANVGGMGRCPVGGHGEGGLPALSGSCGRGPWPPSTCEPDSGGTAQAATPTVRGAGDRSRAWQVHLGPAGLSQRRPDGRVPTRPARSEVDVRKRSPRAPGGRKSDHPIVATEVPSVALKLGGHGRPARLTDVSSTCLAQAAPRRSASAGRPPLRDIATRPRLSCPHEVCDVGRCDLQREG